METKLLLFKRSLQTIAIITVLSFFVACNKDLKSIKPDDDLTNLDRQFDSNERKFNIILIVGDDVGYVVPSYTGGESYHTGNVDKLSTGGMQFTHCYSAPETSPGRFMLMTGKYNFRNYGVWGYMNPATNQTIGNMLQDAGYATCFAGKWQLGGGDPSITGLGFQNYSVFNCCAFTDEGYDVVYRGSRYKDPKIFQDGAFLPESKTSNKYGDDIFTDYVIDFIDKNKKNSFFAMYAPALCHSPFSPTPDDPQYNIWNFDETVSDKRFYPSMVEYLDKKVRQIVQHVREIGLEKNTVILYLMGDNGCGPSISSVYNGRTIVGGKDSTNDFGTHVPFIAYCPGTIAPGSINRNLVDFTDFLPTIADLAGTDIPLSYGTIDGVSFAPQLIGQSSPVRSWIFLQYLPQFSTQLYRYVQDTAYKLYGQTNISRKGQFFNVHEDTLELKPIQRVEMTQKEAETRKNFEEILSRMHN